MKNRLIDRFLPMWAKETVLQENRRLVAQNRELLQQIERQKAYIAGLHKGLRKGGHK